MTREHEIFDQIVDLGPCKVELRSIRMEYEGPDEDGFVEVWVIGATYFRKRLGMEIEVPEEILDAISNNNLGMLEDACIEDSAERASDAREMERFEREIRNDIMRGLRHAF